MCVKSVGFQGLCMIDNLSALGQSRVRELVQKRGPTMQLEQEANVTTPWSAHWELWEVRIR